MAPSRSDPPDLWERLRDLLQEKGIDLDTLCAGDLESSRVKVVCVGADLGETLKEVSQTTRDRVVMVRVDEGTSKALDAWVETGAVKSRSEAAALFIREGLTVRARELDQLSDALRGVEEAKKRLWEEARDVLGSEG